MRTKEKEVAGYDLGLTMAEQWGLAGVIGLLGGIHHWLSISHSIDDEQHDLLSKLCSTAKCVASTPEWRDNFWCHACLDSIHTFIDDEYVPGHERIHHPAMVECLTKLEMPYKKMLSNHRETCRRLGIICRPCEDVRRERRQKMAEKKNVQA